MVQLRHHIDIDLPMCWASGVFTIGFIGAAIYYAVMALQYVLNYFLLGL